MTVDKSAASEAAAAGVLRALALKAKGLTGADIERLVREARHKARRGNRQLAFSDIIDILASDRPERPQPLRWRMAIHEAGHAVARLFLCLGQVTSISIDSPTGGYTEGERLTMEAETEQLFVGLLVIRLAGRAAEDELLGSVTAGAGGSPDSDLGQATDLAMAMETALGFAETSPLLYRPVEDRSSLLAYNPLLAERVSARLDDAYDKACNLIRRNSDAIRFLANAMMQHETLEGTDLNAVLGEVGKRMVSDTSDKAENDCCTSDIPQVAIDSEKPGASR
jgi:ATP-dependent Zn protease